MRKTFSLILLVAFINLLVSCYSKRILTDSEEINNQSMGTRFKILSVNTKDGNLYTFNERYPATISGSNVTGTPQALWNFGSADSIIFSNDRQDKKFLWNDGISYLIIAKDKTNFICLTTDTVNIDFDTIAQINYAQYSKTKTTFLIVGTGTLILVALTVTAWALTFSYLSQ